MVASVVDKLFKIFIENYTLKRNIVVDQYLYFCKGQSSVRIYIPNKLERYGVKLFMLGESESEYLSPFVIYTRAQTDYGNNDDDVLLKS